MSALKQTSFETVISMYAVSDNLGSFGKADSWTRANPAMLAAASGTNRKTSVPRNFRQVLRVRETPSAKPTEPTQDRPPMCARRTRQLFGISNVLRLGVRFPPVSHLGNSNNINMLSKLFGAP